ncbi:MAG: hypothetical protein AAFP02_17075 [Bacteroidota bacterium]
MSKRIDNIKAGADELLRWLVDTVYLGTAERHSLSAQDWQALSARMIDAQARGLANRILQLAQLFEQPDWQASVLDAIGELYLLCQSLQRLDSLPSDLQGDLLTLAGVSQRKKDLLEQPGYHDNWLVLGRKVRQEQKMEVQQTWLYSPTHKRYAQLLEFAVGRGGRFETQFEVGTSVEAEMRFFPAVFPLRAWFGETASPNASFRLPDFQQDIGSMLQEYNKVLQRNPFLYSYPCTIDGLIPYEAPQQFRLRDQNGLALPLPPQYNKIWPMMAISGGKTCCIFGEWNGRYFTPLGIQDQNQWTRL